MSVFLRKVQTEYGWVRGLPAGDPRITSFKGIPFAKPPVGDLRWTAPQKPEAWDGELLCYEFAPISVQARPGVDADNIYSREWNVDPEICQNEDCLYLNVWTPAKTGDEKLPVFVWYFGGGLQVGNTAEMEFDGERFARRGIVFVSVNYRVNAFGFLAHPELTQENPEAPSNFGHLDQKFGTEWVKRNIAAFGGDPDNITIGGQSAGGMSVTTQLTSPQTEGLFQRAIIESGFFKSVFRKMMEPRTLEEAEKQGQDFFRFLGVETLAEARKLDADYIRDKVVEYQDYFGTVIDGKFQTESYEAAAFEGKRWDIPLLIGWTDNEFFDIPEVESIQELKELIGKRFPGKSGLQLQNMISDMTLEEAVSAVTQQAPEYGSRMLLAEEEKQGIRSHRYAYVFGPEMPGWDNPGAFHSSDLWFFFETLAKCWRPFVGKHYDLARKMCNYWTNFVKTGDPNGIDQTGIRMPEWKPYTAEEPIPMAFYDDAGMSGEDPDPFLMTMIQAGPDGSR